jgi:hypothetical protein
MAIPGRDQSRRGELQKNHVTLDVGTGLAAVGKRLGTFLCGGRFQAIAKGQKSETGGFRWKHLPRKRVTSYK